jgi:hypothetical protein
VSCSGLHCAGCAGGMAVPVVPLVAFLGLEWVAEHLIAVAAVSAACGILSVAAVVALTRWCERRETRAAARTTLWIAREVPAALPRPDRPAIAPVHIHFHGAGDGEQAEVIRRALGRPE